MLRRRAGTNRSLAAVVFTDVAGSTETAARLGDDGWKKLLERHLRGARAALRENGGREIDTAGDGLYATFPSPWQAIAFALDAEERSEFLGIRLRSGIHMGEVEEIGGKAGGIAVHIGARIAALAAPGEVLVSSTVRDLATGAACEFDGRGSHELKGVPGTWTVFRALPVERADELPPEPAVTRWDRLRGGMRTRRGVAAMLVGVALVVGVVAIAVVSLLQPRYLPGIESNSVGRVNASGDGIVASVAAGRLPDGIASGAGSIWVTDAGANTLLRIDPSGSRIEQKIDVGTTPAAVTFGHGSVWVANSGDRTVSRVNPDTNEQVRTITVGNDPTDVAADDRWVWVTNRLDGTLARIDPKTNEATTFPVGTTPIGVAAAAGAVWVADFDAGEVVRLDPSTGTIVARVGVGHGPTSIAATADQVWVVNSRDGTVSHIDPHTNNVVGAVPVGDQPESVAVTAGTEPWVTVASTAELVRIDPAKNVVDRRLVTGSRPRDVAMAGEEPWFTSRAAPTTHRGGTLVVVGTKYSLPSTYDPQDPVFQSAELPTLVAMTNDGLVAFKHVGGADGLTLVPDLATTLPPPTDGGLTYTFTLRTGILYSDGSPVRASDVLASVERFVDLNTPEADRTLFGSIEGVTACSAATSRCDLSGSIAVDDAAGSVTFHLATPDPEFLQKLAQPGAYVLPAATPHHVAAAPLPATGPYVANPREGDGTLRVTTNTSFHEWSAEAQPAGYPDTIVFRPTADDEAATDAVATGDADYLLGAPPPDRVDQLRTSYPGQLHVLPLTRTFFEFMNTTIPPFDNPDVRRAINLATDRSRVVELWGGGLTARVTCQAIPPGFPGYEPYCPDTISPGPEGSWRAPDIATARSLVEAAGVRGTKVTVESYDKPRHVAVGEYFVQLLNDLGFAATLEPKPPEEVNALADPFHAGIQMMGLVNGITYPSPSLAIWGVFTCPDFAPYPGAPLNYAAYCDLARDARSLAAYQLQASNPRAANDEWAAIDREIVNESPAVDAFNPTDLRFVSQRVGNVQVHPTYLVLLSQMWVQ